LWDNPEEDRFDQKFARKASVAETPLWMLYLESDRFLFGH